MTHPANLVRTSAKPDQDDKFYVRQMYHEYVLGPFDTLEEVGGALRILDHDDRGWDFDPLALMRGGVYLNRDSPEWRQVQKARKRRG